MNGKPQSTKVTEGVSRPVAYLVVLGRMADVARQLGYTLAIHGSMQRDCDVVAVPWTGEAVSQRELAEALIDVSGGFLDPLEADDEYFRRGCPGGKPHGRLCWSIHLGGGPYIDLSVMPPRSPPYEDPPQLIE